MLLAAGSILGQQACVGVAAKSNRGRIGIQLYSVKDDLPKDFLGTLKKLSDIGYSFVEPYGFTTDDFFGHTMKDLSNIVKDMGMTVSGSHIWADISVSDSTGKEWDFWKNSAGIIKSGNAEWAILSSVPEIQTLDDLKRTVAYFNHAGEVCKAGDVKFGFHNHYDEFREVEGEMILDFLIKNTDPQLVSFQLDLGHVVNGGGDCLHYLRNYPGRIKLWHASDFDTANKTYIEAGKGNVPYPELFDLAESSGLERLIVEQETESDIFASCKADFDYLKQYKWTKV
jgi:sugar phosphate isomerase/epimerase